MIVDKINRNKCNFGKKCNIISNDTFGLTFQSIIDEAKNITEKLLIDNWLEKMKKKKKNEEFITIKDHMRDFFSLCIVLVDNSFQFLYWKDQLKLFYLEQN